MNYERAGLVSDVNAAFGRNRRRDVLREKAETAPEMLDAPVQDDELKAACAQVGRHGPRAHASDAGLSGAGCCRCGGSDEQDGQACMRNVRARLRNRFQNGAGRGVRVGHIARRKPHRAALLSPAPPGPASARLQVRSTGKALPKRLTSHQRQIVGRLLAAHGDDIPAMARDRKLNSMQHSEGVLRALVESYHYWKEGSGVDFRVPNKRLW